MSNEVGWTRTAIRELNALPEKVATAAVELIYGAISDNPERLGKPLTKELQGLRSARMGDYRVIYTHEAQAALVTIMSIRRRSDAYRER